MLGGELPGGPPVEDEGGKADRVTLEVEGLRAPLSVLFPGDPNIATKARAFRDAYRILSRHMSDEEASEEGEE